MSLKILGGFARGQIILVPKSEFVRPTSVMLRRRIFDFYQDLSGVNFVDLCAGSGAMGFEAWSRGARRVELVEANKHIFRGLQENRESLSLRNHHKKNGELNTHLNQADKWIKEFRFQYEKWPDLEKEETILFLDPPYSEKKLYLDILQFLTQESWYFGQLWIESDPQKGLSKNDLNALGLESVKIFEQGESFIYVTNFPQSLKL